MRVLGLDLGRRRIGLAVSDPKGVLALPIGALERRDLARDLEALRSLASERGVERIVVGLPIHMSGRAGTEAEAARAFARALAEATGLPVDTLDERWTTVEAERMLRESGSRARRRRDVVDSLAASILLRTYLARLANEANRDEPSGR